MLIRSGIQGLLPQRTPCIRRLILHLRSEPCKSYIQHRRIHSILWKLWSIDTLSIRTTNHRKFSDIFLERDCDGCIHWKFIVYRLRVAVEEYVRNINFVKAGRNTEKVCICLVCKCEIEISGVARKHELAIEVRCSVKLCLITMSTIGSVWIQDVSDVSDY